MNKDQLLTIIFVSFSLMIALTGIFFFTEQAVGTPLPAFDFMDFLIRVLPGDVITFGIDNMSNAIIEITGGDDLDSTAKTVEQWMAVLQFIGLGALIGTIYGVVVTQMHKGGNFMETELATGLGMGFVVAVPVMAISAEYNVSATTGVAFNSVWFLVAFLAWGAAHNLIYRQLFTIDAKAAPAETSTEPTTTDSSPPATAAATPASLNVMDRRQFLIQIGAATASITVVGAGLGALLGDEEVIEGQNIGETLVRTGLEPAPGTRPEYTPLENHYRIDINSGRAPNINEEDYRLEISGLVGSTVMLSLDEIRNEFEPVDQFVTLSCISNRIAGSLISTTQWTGVPMTKILERVELNETATHIKITSFDGFFEYVALETIYNDERVMLTYAWDGVPLPGKHGFPLRIYIPDHYGMKQPKWIEKMELVDSWEEGYWVERGWSATALVKTTSVIDTVAVDDIYERDGAMVVPIGGIAYSGARGISKVEVQVDDGEWLEAELLEPLSETTWVLWRLDWEFEPGEHEFTVRATEGDGETLQIEERAPQRPDGATGYHSVDENIPA